MTKRFRAPLSDEQRQYLQDLVQEDLREHRQYLEELLTRGHEMTSTLDTDVELAEAHVSRASGMSEMLRVLTPEETQ